MIEYNFNLNTKQQETFQRLIKQQELIKQQNKTKPVISSSDVDKGNLTYLKARIDNKSYTFVLTPKQEKEFQQLLKMNKEIESIQYIKLHFGCFENIDYKKVFNHLKYRM